MLRKLIQHIATRSALLALVISFGSAMAQERVAGRALPSGWSSWAVKAAPGARNWCCFTNFGNSAERCNLDAREQSYGSRDHSSTDKIRLYAKVDAGKLAQLRVFGASCPVDSNSPVTDLGELDAKPSLAWLDQGMTQEKLSADTLLAAMAMHEQADSYLRGYALGHKSAKVRGQSWFWRTQVPVAGVENEALAQLSRESAGSVHEQIVFAISQLPAPRAIPALISAIENRKLSWNQRKKAFFWLAQSKDKRALDYLDAALAKAP